jgi:hypothetical protein
MTCREFGMTNFVLVLVRDSAAATGKGDCWGSRFFPQVWWEGTRVPPPLKKQ